MSATSKHTPGPWSHHVDIACKCGYVSASDHPVAKVISGDWGDDYPSIRLVGGSLERVAEAYMDQITYGRIDQAEADANARLIAAARSEAQPSGYDGGESLGERPIRPDLAIGAITVAMKTTTDGEVGPWLQTALDFLTGEYEPLDDAALTFTASLSDASEVEEEIGHPTPLGALKFRMEQGGHSQTDFAKLIGNRSHASEILAGKRSLSKAMIATLADEWGIPARSLLGPGITASLSDASPSSGDE